MIDWLAQTPALLVSIAVVFGPGLLVAAAFGLRGLALWALAPALGTTTLTGAALVLGLVGVPWRPWWAALAVLLLAGAAFGVRVALRLRSVPRPQPDPLRSVLYAGLAIGVLYTALRIGFYIGDPTAISQTNDAAFHLSALRFAIETGAASPLEISRVIGAESFYPSGWHVLTSLVPQLTGASIEVAANTVSLVLAAAVWPLGIAYLTRAAAGTMAAAIAAVLAGSIAAFPLLLLQWGILYPQLLAVAVLPSALAVVVAAKALSAGDGAYAARVGRVSLLAALAVGAIVVAQPSVMLAWAAVALTVGISALILARRVLTPGRLWGASAALAAGALATAAAWWYFSGSVSVTWPPSTGKAAAVLEVIANAHLGYPPAILVSVLAIIGLVVAVVRPRLRWLAVSWVGLAGLYIVAAAIGAPIVRGLLVGAWYEDPYRLAALTPVVTLPLAGIGAAWLVDRVTVAVRRGRAARPAETVPRGRTAPPARIVAWGAVAVVAVAGGVALAVQPEIDRRDVFAQRVDPNLYTVSADSFLSTDELTLLRRLDQTVPEGAVVVANPSTGASFGYAISGRDVIPRTWAPPGRAEYSVLWLSLRDAASDPAVCSALDSFGAEYVLDFGPGEQYPGRWVMPGFTDLEGQPGFTLVDREGAASLWQVTACG